MIPPDKTAPLGADNRGRRNVLLICDHATDRSLPTQGTPVAGSVSEVYARLITSVLGFSDLDVVLHMPRRRSGLSAVREAISRLSPTAPARVRIVTDTPLRDLLPVVDGLVSFASSALIEGCRQGLKPIQIGRFLPGSAAFSHIFADIDAFAAALGANRVECVMSLSEYADFEAFRDAHPDWCNPDSRSSATAARRADIVERLSRLAIIAAIANPFAAFRLLHAGRDPAPDAKSSSALVLRTSR